jgi:hypothetical protein
MRSFRRVAVVVLLSLAVGASQGVASPSPGEAASREAKPAAAFTAHGIIDLLRTLLRHTWSKEGCRIDPWGRCLASTPTTEAGCRMDPWGRCADSTPAADTGCHIDPLGCANR